ncbi:MAG: amino acid permease, partial [Desulfobacteraceae bacterium]|nr:amino acid permease [Desulfobacteraceae bacterium]
EGEGVRMLKLQEESESELRSDIAAHGFAAFPLVVFAPDLDIALNTLIQSTGVGPLKANTILLNWLDPESEIKNDQREINFGRSLRAAYRLGRNIVVLSADEDKWNTLENIPGENRRIDVWWLNDATSRLMLLLGYLITRSEPWDAAKIRVLAAGYKANTPENLTDLKNNLEEARIEAEPIIVTNADIDKLSKYSADAAVVFLPFRLWGDQVTCPIDVPIEEIVSRLPVTAFVLAAEDIALDAEPEEGTAGEMATAMDALADAEKKAVEAEKEASRTREIAETAGAKLLELENNTQHTEEDVRTKLKAAAVNAEKEADKAFRKAAKARAKVEDAAKIVKDLDPTAELKEKKEQ